MPKYVVRLARTEHIDLLIEADTPEQAGDAAWAEGDEIASDTASQEILEVKPFERSEYASGRVVVV